MPGKEPLLLTSSSCHSPFHLQVLNAEKENHERDPAYGKRSWQKGGRREAPHVMIALHALRGSPPDILRRPRQTPLRTGEVSFGGSPLSRGTGARPWCPAVLMAAAPLSCLTWGDDNTFAGQRQGYLQISVIFMLSGGICLKFCSTIPS